MDSVSKIFLSVFLILLTAGFVPVASAKAIEGQVVSVNPKDRQVTIEKTGEPSGDWVTVQINGDTLLSGVTSLQELEIGEEVRMEANRRYFFGPWLAESLSSETPAAAASQVAAKTAPVEKAEVKEPEEVTFDEDLPSLQGPVMDRFSTNNELETLKPTGTSTVFPLEAEPPTTAVPARSMESIASDAEASTPQTF